VEEKVHAEAQRRRGRGGRKGSCRGTEFYFRLFGGYMKNSFSEVKLFQVKPEKTAEFETLTSAIADEQKKQPGCKTIKYQKRFFTIDKVELGEPPRELTKIVKCVKYFSYWEFDSKENYGKANGWFFKNYEKQIQKLLIMPFDINCGNNVC
jgi:hypothetical protein